MPVSPLFPEKFLLHVLIKKGITGGTVSLLRVGQLVHYRWDLENVTLFF